MTSLLLNQQNPHSVLPWRKASSKRLLTEFFICVDFIAGLCITSSEYNTITSAAGVWCAAGVWRCVCVCVCVCVCLCVCVLVFRWGDSAAADWPVGRLLHPTRWLPPQPCQSRWDGMQGDADTDVTWNIGHMGHSGGRLQLVSTEVFSLSLEDGVQVFNIS